MITLVTGIIGHAIAIAFLGWLAYDIAALPLAIVIIGGIAVMLADFVISLRRREYTD